MATPMDFRVKNGLVVTTTATILGTTQSTSTTTGALIVSGGTALQGNLNVFGDANIGTTTKASLLTVNNTTTSALNIRSNAGFISPNSLNTITVRMLDSDVLTFNGAAGQLFSISDSFTGTIFAVNDISGVPSIEVYDTGLVSLAEFTGNVGIGTTSTTAKLTVNGGASISGITTVTNTSNSTSTTTGALQVVGGVGIGRDVWIGGTLNVAGGINATITGTITTATTISITNDTATSTAQYLTFVSSAAASPSGTALKIDTTDLVFIPSTGRLGIGNTTPASKLDVTGDARISGITTVTNTTNATSTTTGALQVVGGVGIGGNLYVGGEIVAQKLTIELTTITTTLVQTDDIIKTVNTTNATSTTTGALQVAGGAGIGRDLYVGGTINATGFINGNLTGNAATVSTIQNASTSFHYLTFVDSNNASSAGELIYTTSSFIIQPSTGNIGIGNLNTTIKFNVVSDPGNSGNATAVFSNGSSAIQFLPSSNAGAWNSLAASGDQTIIFRGSSIDSTVSNLVIGPWSASGLGIKITSVGNVGIGISPPVGQTLRVGKNITGATNSYGIVSQATVMSDVTSAAYMFSSFPSTQAASFTLSTLRHYDASQGTITSTVTNQIGFYADSSLTSATNNYGFFSNIPYGTGRWNFYSAGFGENYSANRWLIGRTYQANEALGIYFNSGVANSAGVYNDTIISSATTSSFTAFSTYPGTAAAAFTLPFLYHYRANQNTIGANSTVTNQYGFVAEGNLTGATNNYGFFSAIPGGTNRFNFYASGTATNYFAGNVGIGTNSPTSLLHVAGDTLITGITTVTNTSNATSTTTGALQIVGGVGIGGSVVIGNTLTFTLTPVQAGINLNNNNIIGVNSLIFADPGPGEGIDFSSNFQIYESPDDLVTNTGGNLQFVANGVRRVTIKTTGQLEITTTTNATSTTTGALVVAGGAGIGGTLWVENSIYARGGAIELRDETTASVMLASFQQQGLGVVLEMGRLDGFVVSPAIDFHSSGGNIDYDSRIISVGGSTSTIGQARLDLIANQVYLSSTQSATSTTTGALIVAGGAGIGQDLRVGGTIYGTINGTLIGNAATVSTVERTNTTTHFLTFVDSNNSSAGAESVYTTSSFTIIPSSGNVGIGTTSPAVRLQISGGNLRLDNNRELQFLDTPGNVAKFVLQSDNNFVFYNSAGTPIWSATSATNAFAIFGGNNNNRIIIDAANSTTQFVVNGSERARINSSGNVGIANSSPSGQLHVGPTGADSSGIILGTFGHYYRYISVPAKTVATATSETFSFYFGRTTNGLTQITLYGAGWALEEGAQFEIHREWGLNSVPKIKARYGSDISEITWHFTTSTTDLYDLHLSYTYPAGVPTGTANNFRAKVINNGQGYFNVAAGVTTSTTSTNLISTDFNINSAGSTLVLSTANSISTTTGALQVTGGVGIGQDLRVGGTIHGNVNGSASQVNTIERTTNASHFVTFVDSNNTSTTAESVYTTSSFVINPNTGNVGIGTNAPTSRLHVSGTVQITGITTVTNTTNATSTTTGALQVVGGAGIGQDLWVGAGVYATTKSFLIPHPTKPGMRLRYGSLEGPENGIYIRGRLQSSNIIELPEYWTKLVDPESITVNLTPIGRHQNLYVESIADNKVIVGNSNLLNKDINCFYTVFAERKDVEKLQVEIY